jgi:hypothetical protein
MEKFWNSELGFCEGDTPNLISTAASRSVSGQSKIPIPNSKID